MITKREVEMAEEIIERMSENQYSGLLGWLADGCEKPLWNYVQPWRYRAHPTVPSPPCRETSASEH
jgi:hypothetical protein